MAVTESRLSNGDLKVGTPESTFACQITSATLTRETSDPGDPVEMLCGDVITGETTTSDVLALGVLSDFTKHDGMVAYSWQHDGETVPFTFTPAGPTGGPTITGNLVIRALPIGGEVGKRIPLAQSWPVVGKAVPVWPTAP